MLSRLPYARVIRVHNRTLVTVPIRTSKYTITLEQKSTDYDDVPFQTRIVQMLHVCQM